MRNRRPPRLANIPMVTETHQRLALELHLAVETLIALPSSDAFNQLSKMFAALCAAGMAGTGIDLATDTMCGICDRYEVVDTISVNAIEAHNLRHAIGAIDKRIARIPVNKFEEAVAAVEVFCAAVGT